MRYRIEVIQYRTFVFELDAASSDAAITEAERLYESDSMPDAGELDHSVKCSPLAAPWLSVSKGD